MPAIVQKTVFISYRRSVAPYIARAIFLALRSNGYDVFMDIESIGPGEFESIILGQIEARAHFLSILTPGTLERCCEPGDWLRREIEYALKTKRNVIPVLVNNFRFEDVKELLTGDLEKLQGYQGLPLFHEYFDAGMERLCDRFLTKQVDVYVEPTPEEQVPEVQRKIEEATEEPPPTDEQLSAEGYFYRGFFKGELGDWEGAIADYDEAIRLNPQLAEAYYNRGVARGKQGDMEGAIADYNEAIRLNPQYAYAYSNRGTIYFHLGNLEDALADDDKAVQLDPKNAWAFSNRSETRYLIGHKDEALSDAEEAIRLDPTIDDPYKYRGHIRRECGDLPGALADYKKYLELGGGERNGDRGEIERLIEEIRGQIG